MDIKVLGPGCANCVKLENNVKSAVASLGIEADIEKVTDYGKILAYGVMQTPGLVVNGQVKVYGRVPSPQEIAEILKKSQ